MTLSAKQARIVLAEQVSRASYDRVGQGIGQHRPGGKAYRHSQVRAWVVGERVPTAVARQAIEQWSGGVIPATAWKT